LAARARFGAVVLIFLEEKLILIAANDNKPAKLLRYCDLQDTRGITYSRRHLYNLEHERKFPKRVHLGENRVGWIESEIDGWIAERAASRAA
jgi:prophage regulatory protein